MKLINKILLAVLIVGISTAYSQIGDINSANHHVVISIPTIALLDIESASSNDITLKMEAPTEAGVGFADQINNDLWLNVTSIVAASGKRNILASINAAPNGIDLKVVSAADAGLGAGELGTAESEFILSSTPTNLVTGIKSGYTADGSGSGYNLKYTATPNTSAFGDIESNDTDITVTYTLSL